MSTPFDAVSFMHGPAMKNRFMLSPLTNQQSNPDGTLSDDEAHWLTMRAAGGFGMTVTCPRLVQADPTAAMRELPVARETLAAEGLGPAFLDYMSNWKGFVGS